MRQQKLRKQINLTITRAKIDQVDATTMLLSRFDNTC